MTNVEIAWVFDEIADLLEIKGENPFKIRAYRQGARAVEQLSENVATLAAQGQLVTVKGIGPALAKKITELLETGRCRYYEQLRAEVPPGLVTMLAIPGLGPKGIRLINERLGITTLEQLAEAARNHRLRELPGMGVKMEWNILQGIELLRNTAGKIPLGVAWPLSQALLDGIAALPGVETAAVAGEVRRGKELVEQITLVVAAADARTVIEACRHHPQLNRIESLGENFLHGRGRLGVRIFLVVVPPACFGRGLLYYTGAAAHYRELIELCPPEERGPLLGLGLLFAGEATGEEEPRQPGEWALKLAPLEEEEIYARLGLPLIPPELREGQGEVAAAREGRLPRLVSLEDIRGDLHVHSNWSDGVNDPASMAQAARARGYAYLGIADHSRSLSIARGLSIERLLQQRALIRELNEESEDFRLLAGIEVDILPDGSLDYPDEILAQMDIVIASIHTGFKQEQEKIMHRLESALANPHVHLLGHPSGRLLGRRSPYQVDLDRLLLVAARTGKALEINATGDRLDLGAEAARAAAELGVPLVINTDAHEAGHLQDMRYGVAVARRARLEPHQVLNTLDWEELQSRLARSRASGLTTKA